MESANKIPKTFSLLDLEIKNSKSTNITLDRLGGQNFFVIVGRKRTQMRAQITS